MFEVRHATIVRDSKHERYSNATELLNYLWEVKRNTKVRIITWKIARKVYGNPKNNFCWLCLIEKLLITKLPN